MSVEPSVKITLKVIPGASRDVIGGWLGDALKVKVRTRPERGKANASVEKLLAKQLALTPAQVTICSGHTSQHKVVEIKGLTLEAVKHRLASQ
ncbi:MAG: hypothetical protein ACI9GW_001014 [Halieaceae bacterium]